MEQYVVSARKYRPDTFETLIGQDNIVQTLKNSILRGQLAHAYLFCGPRGVGKTTTARIFAKAINCSNPSGEMEPCGKCESCLSFAEGRSYCIHELDAASNNGVDDIKVLMDQVRIPPQVGQYSVYIIDEVHMLSQSAFNAFLKTLEEPPAHAIFILATTEKHKILPTILSRCQTYDFNRITVDNIVRQLREIAGKEGVNIDDESLHIIATKADGAMRDALTIFDQTVAFCGTDVKYADVLKNLNVLDYEYSFALTDAFMAGDYAKALVTFDEILTKGFNALHFVAALSSHFRDLIVSKSAGLEALIELPVSLKIKYKEQADRCPLKFLYEALGITTACESGYRASVNPRLHIEFALMKLSTLMTSLPAAPAPTPQPAAPVIPSVAPAAPAPMVAPEPTPTPQPAEQPAVAPQAEEIAPVRRTRAARTVAAGVSLKAISEEKKAAEILPEESLQTVELTEDSVKEKWAELAKLYETQPRLASTISSAKLELSREDERKVLVFKVFNVAQRDWIAEKRLRELEANFQKITASNTILRVDVIPEEESEPVIYMPSEKAKVLMDANEEVKHLVTDFSLDIK